MENLPRKVPPKSSAMPKHTPSTAPALNDDCLLEIFSNLSAIDLSAIKRSSRWFSELADFVALQRYRKKTFEYCTSTDHGTSHSGCVAALHDFGAFMHTVVIEMDCFCRNYDRCVYASPGFGRHNCSADEMLAALKHCINLKSLTLVRVQLHNVSTRKVSKVLRGLEHLDTLQLIECDGIESNIARIVKSCKSLANLTLHADMSFAWTEGVTDNILNCITELKTLECVSFSADDLRSTFVENVGKLCDLKSLKKLVLGCGGCAFNMTPAIHALASADSLENLVLVNLIPDNAIGRALDRFTRLKSCVIKSYLPCEDHVLASLENFERSLHLEGQTIVLMRNK